MSPTIPAIHLNHKNLYSPWDNINSPEIRITQTFLPYTLLPPWMVQRHKIICKSTSILLASVFKFKEESEIRKWPQAAHSSPWLSKFQLGGLGDGKGALVCCSKWCFNHFIMRADLPHHWLASQAESGATKVPHPSPHKLPNVLYFWLLLEKLGSTDKSYYF